MQTLHRASQCTNITHRRARYVCLFVLILSCHLHPATRHLCAQVLPDRVVILDPLGDPTRDTAGYTWLNGAHMYAEFSRYLPGDSNHRWSARLGGVAELVRWDSSADISIIGTMEIVMDPLNDISFNPRAIFWEEGLVAGFRLGDGIGLQAGYVHRCKHDIDNLEITLRGRREQRTLIYSGLLTRVLFRRRPIVDGAWRVDVSGAVRNDFFMHLLDDRIDIETRGRGNDIEALVDALNIVGRIEARPRDARWRLQASANFMASVFGATPGFSERFSNAVVLGSLPYVELGFALVNPRGSTFAIFVRNESYRDGGVASIPEAANITMLGVRIGDTRAVW